MSYQFDPEVRALLEEAVQDPNSYLGRVPTKRISTWLDSGETLSAQTPRLTTSEQYLLEVHREEVAELLYEEAYRRLTEDSVRLLGRRASRTKEELLGRAAALPQAKGDLELAQRTVQNGGDRLKTSRLVTMALSVAFKPLGKLYFAEAISIEGNPALSEATLSRMSVGRLSVEVRSALLCNLAASAYYRGDFLEAHQRSRAAVDLDSTRAASIGSLLTNSLLVGNMESADLAVHLVESWDLPRIESYAQELGKIEPARGWSLPDGWKRKQRGFIDRLSEQARIIVNAIC